MLSNGGNFKNSPEHYILSDSHLFALIVQIINRLYQIQRRIQKGGKIYEFYTTKNWQFDNKYALICRKQLNDCEKLIYKIDGDGFEMREYFTHCIRAVRRNILKESDDMLPAAKRNLKMYVNGTSELVAVQVCVGQELISFFLVCYRMWAVDKSVKLLLLFAFFYYCYVFLSHF